MKALVTGATGFIGSHLAEALKSKGFEVRCTYRKTSNLRWLKSGDFEMFEASLSDKEALKKAVEGVDYIYHIAGLTSAKNYEGFLKGNAEGTKNLLDAALEVNPGIKRFLFMSSLTAAGPSKSLEEPNTEGMPCEPLTSYGKSKKAAEDIVMQYKDKLPATIVRPPAVFGPRDTEIYAIFKTARAGLGTLIGMKPKHLSLVHSSSLVKGTIMAAESEKAAGNIYYISDDEIFDWDRLMDVIKNALGKKHLLKIKLPHFLVLGLGGVSGFFGKFRKKPPVFNYEKGIDFIQKYWTCSSEKAKRDFNYSPVFTVEEGINDAVRWYKENGWL